MRYGMIIALTSLLTTSLLAEDTPHLTAATIETWTHELSNWGRWGKTDQIGTLNLITPTKRKAAAALVTEGVTISLSREFSRIEGPNNPHPVKQNFLIGKKWASDTFDIRYHGYKVSHIDALCHISHEGKLYNGYSKDALNAKDGATTLDVATMHNGIFTRGILIDVPRLKNIPYLDPTTKIMPADIDAWLKIAKIKTSPGDIILIRTGRDAREAEKGEWKLSQKGAGLHASAAKWLKDHDVAVLGSDGASDAFPSGINGVSHPIHHLALVAMGMPLLDNLNLETLAEEAAKQKRWSFLLIAAPLRIPGGTGSPVNPIAVF